MALRRKTRNYDHLRFLIASTACISSLLGLEAPCDILRAIHLQGHTTNGLKHEAQFIMLDEALQNVHNALTAGVKALAGIFGVEIPRIDTENQLFPASQRLVMDPWYSFEDVSKILGKEL